ncbi:hypothetical protein [Escherichia coli]
MVKLASQPGASVARIAREHGQYLVNSY